MKKNHFPILFILFISVMFFILPQTPLAFGHALSITLTPTDTGPRPTATNTTIPTQPPEPTATLQPTLPSPSLTPTPKNKPPKVPTSTTVPTETASEAPTIVKFASSETVSIGSALEFNLIITNPTDKTITNVKIIDALPPEVDFIDAQVDVGSFSYDADSHTLTLNIGNLEPGQTISVTIRVVVNEQGAAPAEFSNMAILVSAEYGQIESNSVTLYSVPTGVPVTGSGGRNDLNMISILLGTLFLALLGLLKKQVRAHRNNKAPIL
ncbi:MAG: DUF11 domain-containing protein [Anaerolineales bacterium]|nr:DUF11 domain-containing protein [Anaerolineales bacterium]